MPPISSKPKLSEMIEILREIPETVWGKLLFQRDILYHKLSEAEQQEMIVDSIACGRQTAVKLRKKYGLISLEEIFINEQVQLVYQKEEQIGSRVLLALYQSPGEVTLMQDSIQKIQAQTEIPKEIRRCITELILAHELFHHIESHDPNIYTQKKQIVLWTFLSYKYRSAIRTTSEIAAMCFSKELNGVDFPPFLLDILLVYAYDEQQAIQMYEEIVELNSQREFKNN